jgi:hypothetical protein
MRTRSGRSEHDHRFDRHLRPVPTIPDTLAKIGVRTDGVATTRIAGAFDPSRALDPRVGEVIQSVIDSWLPPLHRQGRFQARKKT